MTAVYQQLTVQKVHLKHTHERISNHWIYTPTKTTGMLWQIEQQSIIIHYESKKS
jgi:hypothetical protein